MSDARQTSIEITARSPAFGRLCMDKSNARDRRPVLALLILLFAITYPVPKLNSRKCAFAKSTRCAERKKFERLFGPFWEWQKISDFVGRRDVGESRGGSCGDSGV